MLRNIFSLQLQLSNNRYVIEYSAVKKYLLIVTYVLLRFQLNFVFFFFLVICFFIARNKALRKSVSRKSVRKG